MQVRRARRQTSWRSPGRSASPRWESDSRNVGDGGARKHVHDGPASFAGAIREDSDRATASLRGRVVDAKGEDDREF